MTRYGYQDMPAGYTDVNPDIEEPPLFFRPLRHNGAECGTPTYVLVDGPFPNANKWSNWEEFPEWTVSQGDDDGCCDLGTIHYCETYDAACEQGRQMGRRLGLELVIEASPCF